MMAPKTTTQEAQAATLVQTWLTTGQITPMEALRNIATLRAHGSTMLADILTVTVQAWNDAQMAHTRAMMARGV